MKDQTQYETPGWLLQDVALQAAHQLIIEVRKFVYARQEELLKEGTLQLLEECRTEGILKESCRRPLRPCCTQN